MTAAGSPRSRSVYHVNVVNRPTRRTGYEDVVTHQGNPGKVHRYATSLPVEKGGELGRFEMGSTVILLFEPGRVKWDDSLQPESVVRMGRRIGEIP